MNLKLEGAFGLYAVTQTLSNLEWIRVNWKLVKVEILRLKAKTF